MLACSLLGSSLASAHPPSAEERLQVSPTGRLLMDAGCFSARERSNEFNAGCAIPDLRLGFVATYKTWTAKVDVSYAYGEIGLKDAYLEHRISSTHRLRIGHFKHHFGLQSPRSSSARISMEEPAANEAFSNSRLPGVMLTHNTSRWLGTLSVFAESEAMKRKSEQLGKPGVGIMSRWVFRPLTRPGTIFHIGLSGAVETPRYHKDASLNHSSFVLNSHFPTRIAKISAAGATIDHARRLYKFTPEITAAYGRFGMEAQYYGLHIDRHNTLPGYSAHGGYCTLRALLKGGAYRYDHGEGSIKTPDAGAMELVVSYTHADLTDEHAGLFGGHVNDWSATFNYHLNPYVTWRLRASHTRTSHRNGMADNGVGMLETRLQIKF